MVTKQRGSHTASCRCGAVALELTGAPLAHAACYCTSCQEAGRQIGQLADAPPVLSADGGSDYVLYRKDRVRCVRGAERMEVRRLKPESPTRRMVATCCNSAMALDFTKGHWLTVYSGRLPPEAVPPLDGRVMTAEKGEGVVLPDDALNHAGHSGKVMGKLLGAWLRMGFRVPKVEGMPAG